MAIIVQNKFPIDNIGRKAIGINIPFNAPAVFQSNYITRDAVRNNLMNFFSTRKGERVFNPFFGSAIIGMLYENISADTLTSINKIIRDELNNFFPFVSLVQTDVNIDEDNNQIDITIKYQVVNFGIQDEINITL